MGSSSECPVCHTDRMVTTAGRFYKHTVAGRWCDGSGTVIPSQRPAPSDISDPNVWLMNQGATGTEVQPMTGQALEIAARLKEMFYAYDNRRSSDNRSAQSHLGPSEIGTPCDRRIAMSVMRVPPVNPGGDGWAAFVGTCVHAGLAEMLQWADADTGRYATEVSVAFPSVLVPLGTTDALDRMLLICMDHKLMGQWSLTKLGTVGPTPTYRVQVHTYAMGLRAQGEKVEKVAIIGWPRQESTLDNLYVWVEDYDPTIPRQALQRVSHIAEMAERVSWQEFPVADDCRYCPFYLKDGNNSKGCNGKR